MLELFPIQIIRRAPVREDPSFQVAGHDAEVHLPEVPVAHIDRGKGLVPHPLGGDRQRGRLDLVDQVVAAPPADAPGEALLAPPRDPPRPGPVAFFVQRQGPFVAGSRRQLVIGIAIGELLESRLVTGALGVAGRHVLGELEAPEVGIDARGRVLVRPVESEQVLIETDGLENRRPGVGAGDPPSYEFLGRREDRALRREVESVLGAGARLLAGSVEGERLVGDEVVEGRPIGVGGRARVDQVVVGRDRRSLEEFGGREGAGEMGVDLGVDPGQVPGGEVVAGRLAGSGAIQEAPAVLAEVLPEPLAEDRLHHRPHLGRRSGDLCLHAADLLFGLVAVDVGFERDPRRSR